MTPIAKEQWLRRLGALADQLGVLSGECPHCRAAGLTDCALCNPIWHASEALLSYANLVQQATLPESIEE